MEVVHLNEIPILFHAYVDPFLRKLMKSDLTFI